MVGMVPLFKGMPEDVLTEIARQAHVVTFLVDDTIIGEGDHGNALYIVVKGQVGVYHLSEGVEEEQVAVLGAGDFIGETALLGDSVRTATVRALNECTLLRITQKTIAEISEEHPVVAERLQEELIARKGSEQ
jgi:CRP-like cAMP-binding protein